MIELSIVLTCECIIQVKSFRNLNKILSNIDIEQRKTTLISTQVILYLG